MTSSAVCALTALAFLLDAALLAAAAKAAGRGMAVILGDPDGDVVPAGRFVHARHPKRDMRHFRALIESVDSSARPRRKGEGATPARKDRRLEG
jgi:hypothetical protein